MKSYISALMTVVFLVIFVLLSGCSESKIEKIETTPKLLSEYHCTPQEIVMVNYMTHRCISDTPLESIKEYCKNRATVKACTPI